MNIGIVLVFGAFYWRFLRHHEHRRAAQWQIKANKIKPLLPCSAMKFIFQPDASKPSL